MSISGHVWTQYTANGTLMDEWNVNKMEAVVRRALTAYFDDREGFHYPLYFATLCYGASSFDCLSPYM